MNYAALSDKEEENGKAIVDSAYSVHKTLYQRWNQSLDPVTLCLSDFVTSCLDNQQLRLVNIFAPGQEGDL